MKGWKFSTYKKLIYFFFDTPPQIFTCPKICSGYLEQQSVLLQLLQQDLI